VGEEGGERARERETHSAREREGDRGHRVEEEKKEGEDLLCVRERMHVNEYTSGVVERRWRASV